MPAFNIITSPIDSALSVVEASAGTGKTYALAHLVPRLLLEGKATSLSEILLVTFTNDAAKELSERTRRVIELLASEPSENESTNHPHVARLRHAFAQPNHRAIISRALGEIDRLSVSTIHSFCLNVLQTEGTLCGFPVIPELIASSDELLEEAIHDLWQRKISSNPTASTLAVSLDWKIADDLWFFRSKLPLHAARPEPMPPNFGVIMTELESLPPQFTGVQWQELRSHLAGLSWKKGFSASEAADMLDTLEAAQQVTDPGFFESLVSLAGITEFVPKKSNTEKSVWAIIDQSPLIQLARHAAEQIRLARWSFRIGALPGLHREIQQSLRKSRKITYDGLIDAVATALKGDHRDSLIARLRSRYRIALIDESQDTDPKQFGIFSAVYLGSPDHSLVLVGDPKQAIYGFRGADLNTYLDAKGSTQQLFDLSETFRAPQPLVRAVNALFQRPFSLLNTALSFKDASSGLQHDLLLLDGDSTDPSRIEFWVAQDGEPYSNKKNRNERIAGETATEILRLLQGGACIRNTSKEESKTVRPGDFAVLVSTGDQATEIESALKKRGIAAVRAAGDDVMASEEAADLLAILVALEDPRRKVLRFTALATRLMGRTDSQLRNLPDDDDAELEKFRTWSDLLAKSGPAPVLALMDREEGISARLAQGDDGDRRITNLRQLGDLLQQAFSEHGNHVSKLLRWFGATVTDAKDRSELDERQIQLESDAEAVQIVTMHKAKGLEYPLVFCPFLWDFKDPRDHEKLSSRGEATALVDLKLTSDPTIKAAIRRSLLEERLRLAYVAITRAQVKVWIHAGKCAGSSKENALDWILRTDFCTEARIPDETNFPAWQPNDHAPGIEAIKHAAGITDLIMACEPPVIVEGRWNPDHGNDEPRPVILHSRPIPSIPSPWRMTSFSALTKEKNAQWSPQIEESPLEANIGNQVTPANLPPPNPFLNAQGSNVVGTALHDWIEQWDFHPFEDSDVHRHLSGYSFPKPKNQTGDTPAPPTLEDSVPGMLRELSGAILPGLDISIGEACPAPSASEWHFHLPIKGKLSPGQLASIFARHPQAGFHGYADALSRLNQDELDGFLHGFIDRLALNPSNANWGVVDWKTNRLGDQVSDYRPEKLRSCAMESHYFLQTQLYLVALRRYLGPDKAISGAWLVFLRGVSRGSSHGILHIPYDGELIKAIDGLFAAPSAILN
jgi:exodeoxyribonuclease V beta subunit